MIEFVFTVDYEIYGDGTGPLMELVYRPAERLKAVFDRHDSRFVVFVEVAELEMIEAKGSDPGIELVKQQVRDFHKNGYEIGLHLHPQWYNGRYENGGWVLDYDEYNLCTLPVERATQIIDRSIVFLNKVLGVNGFAPFSFRAGNWLFQPTRAVARLLAERGVQVDSSAFPGGRQHSNNLDFRPALKNGYFWMFSDDVNFPDPQGILVEFPIYAKMVPIWKMFKKKRIAIQTRKPHRPQPSKDRINLLLDRFRFRYPLKLDFCRMTKEELMYVLSLEVRKDKEDPSQLRPIVAIGHTKDLVDFETVEFLLAYLQRNGVRISNFCELYSRLKSPGSGSLITNGAGEMISK
jgi:hypothetical protein